MKSRSTTPRRRSPSSQHAMGCTVDGKQMRTPPHDEGVRSELTRGLELWATLDEDDVVDGDAFAFVLNLVVRVEGELKPYVLSGEVA